MSGRKIVRVYVGVSEGLEEVRLGVLDLMCLLNRNYQARGVEFEPTLPGEPPEAGDLAVALYWKEFGELEKIIWKECPGKGQRPSSMTTHDTF